MPTYVALLRGINIGARNKDAMAELRELLGSLRHKGVRAHILSGNVIFTSRRRSAPRMETELEKAIRNRSSTTRCHSHVSQLSGWAALIATAVLAIGCGSPTLPVSGSAAASAASASAASAASAPSGSASAPSASVAAPSATPGPTISIADPDLAMTLPPGWEEQAVSGYRDRINTESKQNTGSVRAAMEELVRDADAGKVRSLAVGLTDYRAAFGTIIIQVNEGDASLDAAVSRIEKRHDFVPHSDFEERPVDLVVGKAVRMSAIFPVRPNPPPEAIPSHTVDYVVRLEDGRTLWIQASAPEAAKAFDAVIDGTVLTVRAR